jgi:hypothetical protein
MEALKIRHGTLLTLYINQNDSWFGPRITNCPTSPSTDVRGTAVCIRLLLFPSSPLPAALPQRNTVHSAVPNAEIWNVSDRPLDAFMAWCVGVWCSFGVTDPMCSGVPNCARNDHTNENRHGSFFFWKQRPTSVYYLASVFDDEQWDQDFGRPLFQNKAACHNSPKQ